MNMHLRELAQASEVLLNRFQADKTKPLYHFTPPIGSLRAWDPNGAFYAHGRYHLMFLCDRPQGGVYWGHRSSVDLVHWFDHPDALGSPDPWEYCSGGVFVDEDETAYLIFWKLHKSEGQVDSSEIKIARSADWHYEIWEEWEEPVLFSSQNGIAEIALPDGSIVLSGAADPSNIWKKGGQYYVQMGNLLVLEKYGRGEDAPKHLRGDWADLYRSRDLRHWEYVHRFYQRAADNHWTSEIEDCMCPSFFPLAAREEGGAPSGDYLQLFLAHSNGAQYYVGNYVQDQDIFCPKTHGRFAWPAFAPEAMLAPDGRQILWIWLLDTPPHTVRNYAWKGAYCLPRNVWAGEDHTLRMAPVRELECLRHNPQKAEPVTITDGYRELSVHNGRCCELKLRVKPGKGVMRFGVSVRAAEDRSEETLLFVDRIERRLVFDAVRCGSNIPEFQTTVASPLETAEADSVELRIFIDYSVVEVFADQRAAIAKSTRPQREDSRHIFLFSEGGPSSFEGEIWEMMPSNPY